jgi:hypothetical protein
MHLWPAGAARFVALQVLFCVLFQRSFGRLLDLCRHYSVEHEVLRVVAHGKISKFNLMLRLFFEVRLLKSLAIFIVASIWRIGFPGVAVRRCRKCRRIDDIKGWRRLSTERLVL